MDRLKQWLALSLVALLAILAGGWFLLIAPERSEAEELRVQADAAQVANEQLETQLEVLRTKAEQLPAKRAELAEVAEKVPTGPSLPVLVRALTAAARDAGVDLTAVTPGAPLALAAAAPAAPAAPAEGAAPVPAPAAPAATAGLSEVPVVLEAEGDFTGSSSSWPSSRTFRARCASPDWSCRPARTAAPGRRRGCGRP